MQNRTNVARILGLLALTVCALGLPGLAFADNVIQMPGSSGNTAWTVYAFGNAQAVSSAFRSIYNFTSSTLFKDAIGVIALCGALTVGLAGGFSPSVAKRFIGYCVATFLVTYLFFGWGSGGPVVVQVEVEDTVDGTWVAPVTVPAIVGLPAAVISTAGYQLTQQIEASFPIPDALKLSNGSPFNLAAAMVADSTKARIEDPNLASSMAYYVQDCVIPAIARGDIAASTLINSTDFLNDIHVNLPSVYVNTLLSNPVGSSNIVSCNDDWSLINAAVSANGSDAAAYLKGASAWADTPALNVVNAAADTVAQWSTNNGITDGGSMVKQAAVLASFTGAFRQSAAATGNSDFLTALSVTQATDAQKTGWIVGAEIFNRTMGYIFAILQVFVYALTPLIMCVVVVPGVGAPLLKSFGQVLLWLAIWQPMLAIVNFIVLIMQQGDLASTMTNGSAYGMTLSTLGIVSEKTANLRAAATFVGTMVPALAWLFVKGSLDFSRVVGAAVGEHFAQGAANTMTTGNYSLNQQSMDSFTANKHSIGHTGDWGYGMVSTGQGGFTNNINQGGGAALEAMGQRAGIQAGGGLGTNSNGGVVESAGRSAGGGNAYSASRGGGVTQASSTGNSAAGTDSTSTGSGVQASVGDSIQPFRGMGAGQPKNGAGSTMAGGAGAGMAGAPGGVPGQLTDRSLVSRLGGAAAKPVVEALKGVNASVGASMNAGKQHVDANTHSASQTTTGQTTRSGNETKSGQEGYNESSQASSGHGWQHDAGIRVTGIAALADTYAAMRPYREEFHSAFDRKYWGDKRPAPGSTMGQLNQSLDSTDRSAHVTGHERAADDAAQQQLKQRADQNLKEARAQAKAYEGLGSGPAGEVASELDPKNPKSTAARAQAGLGETALPYFKSELKAVGASVAEGAKDVVEKLEDKVLGAKHGEKPGTSESKPAAGSAATLTLQPGMATPAGQALAYAQLTPQVRTPAADSGVAAPAKPGSAPAAPAASTTQAQAPTVPVASTAQAHAPAVAPSGAAPQVQTTAEPTVSSTQVDTPAMETGAAPVQSGSGMQLPTLAGGKAPTQASGASGSRSSGNSGSGAGAAVESESEHHARDKGPVKASSGQPDAPQQPVASPLTSQGGTTTNK